MELSVKNIKKSYGKVQALRDISFSVTEGVYGILGPNGAGKSTLIRILTGNIKADQGEILWNQAVVNIQKSSYKTELGYMPQQQGLYPEFTAIRFLGYIAALKGMSEEEAKIQIPNLLEQVELTDAANQKIKTFSGGMKQRLLIAQAILNEPKLLILDEPTAGLDPKQRIAIRNLIAKIAMDKIVLIATHVVSDVEYIAKEILLLGEGELLCKKSRAELLKEMWGKVWILTIAPSQLKEVEEKFLIASIENQETDLCVRVVTEDPIAEQYSAQEARPQLEDVYLWYFGE